MWLDRTYFSFLVFVSGLVIMITTVQIFATTPQESNTIPEQNKQNLDSAITKLINTCISENSKTGKEECSKSLEKIEYGCKTYDVYSGVPSCNDSRIELIVNKQTGFGQTSVVQGFLDRCTKTTQYGEITSCSDDAKKIMYLCDSMQTGTPSECGDPRLTQVAYREPTPTKEDTSKISFVDVKIPK